MKKSNFFKVALVLTLGLLLLVGCGKKAEDVAATDSNGASMEVVTEAVVEEYKIGVTLESLEAFLGYVSDGITAFDEENDDVSIVILDAKKDTATQLQQVENLISQKVQAIVIKCVDKDATQQISDKCAEAGVKLVATNVDINSPKDAYVGSDHKLSGVLETEYIVELLGGKGNIAVLMGDPSHAAAQDRTDGTIEVVAGFPDIEIIATQSGMWDRAKGMSIAENWIQSGLEIDAVIANNDEMIIGAQMAYEQAGKTGVLFGGIDGTQDSLNMLKEGKLSVTVFQNGFQQGYMAAEAAYILIKGEDVPAYVDVPYEMVTAEQADEYLAKYK